MHRSTGTVALFNRNMQFHLVNNNNMNSIIEIIRSYDCKDDVVDFIACIPRVILQWVIQISGMLMQ